MRKTTARIPLELHRSEADVKRAVMDLLKARGILYFRMQSGDRFGSYKGKTWRIQGCPAGTADILAFAKHKTFISEIIPLWIELKSSIGKQSRDQKLFQDMVEAEGHSYLLARSADDFESWIKKYL